MKVAIANFDQAERTVNCYSRECEEQRGCSFPNLIKPLRMLRDGCNADEEN
jgi:hypothetical protein